MDIGCFLVKRLTDLHKRYRSLGVELVHCKIDKICKLRYTFIDNIYSVAGTKIEIRSQLIEPVEILHICPVSGGRMLQFPTQMKTSRPMI